MQLLGAPGKEGVLLQMPFLHVAILYFLIAVNKKLNHTSQTPLYYFWYSVVYIIYPKVFCWKKNGLPLCGQYEVWVWDSQRVREERIDNGWFVGCGAQVLPARGPPKVSRNASF